MKEEQHSSVPSAFWPVVFPLLVGAALVSGVLIWAIAASAGGSDLSRFADLSAVLMIILMILISVFPLLLLAGIAYGLFQLYSVLPKGTRWLGDALDQVRNAVHVSSDKVTKPIIAIKSAGAGIRSMFRWNAKVDSQSDPTMSSGIQVMKGDSHE